MIAPLRRSGERAVSIGSVVRRFRDATWTTRAYLQLRRVVLPLDAIERHLPPSGKIVDACCGFGVSSILIALRSGRREVIGLDLDAPRIAAARLAAADVPNVTFKTGDLLTFDESGVDGIVLIDAMHYFAPSQQLQILRALRRALTPPGLLVCRSPVRESRARYWWTWLHERLMVGFSITATHDRQLHFRTLPQFVEQLEAAGFSVLAVERHRPWLPYSDRLFIARAGESPS